MKKKRAITAVVALLLALAVSLNVFAVEVSSVDALKDAFNKSTGDITIDITSDIASDGEIELVSLEDANYVINGNNNTITGGLKISGKGTVEINNAKLNATAEGAAALHVVEQADVTVSGGSVASEKGDGVLAVGGSDDGTVGGPTVSVNTSVSGATNGVNAQGRSKVDVNGAVTSSGNGVKAIGNSNVSVTKTTDNAIASTGDAVTASDNATVKVTGSINSADGKGINVDEGANVTLTGGSITAKTYGIYAYDTSYAKDPKVTVTGNITTTGTGSDYAGVFTNDAIVNVTGNIQSASNGAFAGINDLNKALVITGNIDAAGYGLKTNSNGVPTANITGNITAGGNGVEAVVESRVTIKGSITGGNNGIYAADSAVVTVTGGNVTGSIYGINASSVSKVNVTGNVSGKDGSTEMTKSPSGGGGIYASKTAKVTVDGNVSAGKTYGRSISTFGANGIVAADASSVSVTGSVSGGNISELKAPGGGQAGDAIRMDRTAKVTVGGDAVGGSATGGVAGAGAKIVLKGNESYTTAGSLNVGGKIIGGSATGTATAGDGIKYDHTDGTWLIEQMPTVTLFKAEAGGEGAKAVATSWNGGEDGVLDYVALNNQHNYIVKVDAAANGSVSPSSATAKPGEIVTLSVTPNSGYKIASVSVDGAELKTENGVYSFVMPANGGVTVSAAFEAVPTVTTAAGPATGDNSHLLLWGALMLASAAVVVFIIIKRKNR